MPIATDNTRFSIDFIYEYTAPDGTVLQYQMKFQHTQAGPTISINNGVYDPVELPADMFSEVSQFLVQQGAMRGATPLPVVSSQSSGNRIPLALPSIGRNKPAKVGGRNVEPLQNISQDSEDTGAVSLESQEDPEKKAEAERLRQMRLEAKARAASAKKPFRAAHKKQ